MAGERHSMFSASSLIAFVIGVAAVLYIFIFRYFMIENTFLADIGHGFISLSAPSINGYNPSLFYRIMHNLTTTWSLVIYFALMSIVTFLLTQMPLELSKVEKCHFILSVFHLVFAASFAVSLFLPIGDLVTILNDSGN